MKEHDIYFINVHGSGWTGKGTPDLITCINGKFVAFELKVGDNDLQPAQKIHRKRIIRNDGLHFSPRGLDEFIEIVEGLK